MGTETGLIGGVAVSLPDGKVRRQLASLHPHVEGCSRRIGLRNEAGVVYRWIRTVGLSHFIDVVAAMISLGYVDHRGEAIGDGSFDAILSPDANRSAAAAQYMARARRSDGFSGRWLHHGAGAAMATHRYRHGFSPAAQGAAL